MEIVEILQPTLESPHAEHRDGTEKGKGAIEVAGTMRPSSWVSDSPRLTQLMVNTGSVI